LSVWSGVERTWLLAQANLKQRIDKAMCMKIKGVWLRLMKIHLKIMFYYVKYENNMLNVMS